MRSPSLQHCLFRWTSTEVLWVFLRRPALFKIQLWRRSLGTGG